MRKTIVVACAGAFMAASALAAPPADKGPKGKGHQGGGGGGDESVAIEAAINVVFSTQERETVERYFSQHPVAVQRLPPGIAKNLARGKPLPPGIAKKQLPGGLVAALPPRAGYQYVMAGPDVLLVQVTTQLVSDIIRNVVR